MFFDPSISLGVISDPITSFRLFGCIGIMNKMTEDNCKIAYPKSQAWILKVLLEASFKIVHVLAINAWDMRSMFSRLLCPIRAR